jgi:lipopolysaccharide export system protein LptC
MRQARPGWRIRLAVLLAVMLALTLGSFWLLEVMRRAMDDAGTNRVRTEPDFYVENFNYVKIGQTGRAQYHFAGTRLTHNPQDDSYDVTRPVLTRVSEDRPPMTMQSDRAHMNSDGSEVHMYDNVHIDRPSSPTTTHLHLSSQYLLLLPDDDVMKTDKPVVITQDLSRLTGTGMFADNANRQFRLLSNVHGTYQAMPR